MWHEQGERDTRDGIDQRPDPAWAWRRYDPDEGRPWNVARAAHLWRRAGFGATWSELERALADGPQRTVDRLLEPGSDVAAFNSRYDEYEAASGSVETLRAWWLRRMIQTPQPLLEKMTLFWHNHFALSASRVNDPRLMLGYIQRLRRHALGRFGTLLADVAGNPALLVGVGAEANRKAMPNDQLARHLLERLTVGPGHFRGEDVREAARALTGWFVLRGRLRFIAREHDPGVKTILGQQGRWGRDDVVRIVLKPPAAARLLVRKLYRWFVSEADEPDDTLLEPLVERLAHSYDVRWVVETILRSNWFFSPMAYRRRVKSPVEFALGIVRGLEGMVGTVELGAQLAALGQDLCRPPTLDGWQGGRWWLNSATMIGRGRLAAALLSDEEPYSGRLDPLAVARSYGHHGREAAVKFLIDLFLQQDLDGLAGPQVAAGGPADADPAAGVRRAAHRIFTLPEFQLA